MELMRQDPRTASAHNSIWLEVPEDTFRQHLLELEKKTGAIPMDPQVFHSKEWLSESRSMRDRYTLPLDVEQQLADDFAFLAAVAEGAQSVAAVCIEETPNPPAIKLRFAALDASRNDVVNTALQEICGILSRAAASSSQTPPEHISILFHEVIRLHYNRLIARLRSSKWEKPKYLSKSHKKPLWKDFENLIHRAQFVYTKQEKAQRQLVENRLEQLSAVYENFEDAEDELASLMDLVDASFTFSLLAEIKDYAQRLRGSPKKYKPTPQIESAIKSLRQVQKIASYRRICVSSVETARTFPTLFQNMTIEYIPPYKDIPTAIGYQEWAKTCHIHAEVQLAVHYDLYPHYRPRCIGTSKWLCYLCYQFLHSHKLFFPSKTHGRLFDQWTIPDLAQFSPSLVQEYRRVVREMNDVITTQIQSRPGGQRPQRMTSCEPEDF